MVDVAQSAAVGLQVRSSVAAQKALVTRGSQRFQLAQLVQHLAPNIHHWNKSTVFSIDRLRKDIGWEPQHNFKSMVDHTYRWYHDAGLAETQPVDWAFEDSILDTLNGEDI